MAVRWSWIARRLSFALAAFWVLVELRHRIRQAPDAYDLAFFMDGARAVAAGTPLYPDGSGYLNGPAFAFLLRPLLAIDHRLAAQLWVLLAAALVPVVAWLGLRIAGVRWTGPDLGAVTLLLALTVPVRHTVTLGQLTVLATAVAMGAWLASDHPRVRVQALGGVLLWFAFELKPHYVWFLVVMLAWRRRRVALAAAATAAGAMNLVLWFAYPSAMWDSWLRLVFASRGSITAQPEQSTIGAAAVRFLGMQPRLAVAVTALVALLVWGYTYRRVRDGGGLQQVAVLAMAALPFVTPFSHPQDWVIGAVAIVVALAAGERGGGGIVLPAMLLLWALPDSRNLYVEPTVLMLLTSMSGVAVLAAWGRLRLSRTSMVAGAVAVALLASGAVMLRSHMQPIAAVIGLLAWAALAIDGVGSRHAVGQGVPVDHHRNGDDVVGRRDLPRPV